MNQEHNNDKIEEENKEETIIEKEKEEESIVGTFKIELPYIDKLREFDMDIDKDYVLLPSRVWDDIVKIQESIFDKENKKYNRGDLTEDEYDNYIADIQFRKFTVKDNTLVKEADKLANSVEYGNDTFQTKIQKFSKQSGRIKGDNALARFSSLLGVGEPITVPLWHSGFSITLRPPTQRSVIILENMISGNEIELGRNTNTMIYSNYSVIYNRIVSDFILEHIITTTLDIPETDDIRKYILINDFYPILNALLGSMHPKGYIITKSCSNTIQIEGNDTVCSSIISANIDFKKLLWVDRTKINKYMLNHMSKKLPNSHTVNDILEYQKQISDIKNSQIKLDLENNVNIDLNIKTPTLLDHINLGEKWINNIITDAETVFTNDDNTEAKNKKIKEMATSNILGIYNSYVTSIDTRTDNGNITIDNPDNITTALADISYNNEAFNIFKDKIKEYINNTTIALVAIPSYKCPKCNKEDLSSSDNPSFKNFIPLNLLELFFVLCIQRINKQINKNLE